jgi:Trypsin-like peptidase domain
MRRLLVFLVALAASLAHAQSPSRADAFALAREATWAVAMLRMAPKGQIDQAAFVGTGFFVSRTHFVTASHVVNAKLLGRSRNSSDLIRIFKNELAGDGFNQMKVIFDDSDLDIAILQSAINTKNWLTVSLDAPREGDEVGSYGYPLVEFENIARAAAFPLGRLGMVAGFGRRASAQRMITTFNVTEGNSGSPVFLTSTGHVVAVQTSQATNSAGKDLDGYSLSTPLSAIQGELVKLGILRR